MQLAVPRREWLCEKQVLNAVKPIPSLTVHKLVPPRSLGGGSDFSNVLEFICKAIIMIPSVRCCIRRACADLGPYLFVVISSSCRLLILECQERFFIYARILVQQVYVVGLSPTRAQFDR